MNVADRFNWTESVRLAGDSTLNYFHREHDLVTLDWDNSVWWNASIATAAARARAEGVSGVDALPSWMSDIFRDDADPIAEEKREQLFLAFASRIPRSEKRCVDHLEVTISHLLRTVMGVAGTPWVVYDSKTGVWRHEGEWASDRDVGVSVGSMVDYVIGKFEAAMHRAIDLCDDIIDEIAPDPAAGAAGNVRALVARRKELSRHLKDARTMARDIPRGKYKAIKSALKERLAVVQTKWDSDTRYLILRDAVLDLEDVLTYGRIIPQQHSPFYWSTMSLDVSLFDIEKDLSNSEWYHGVRKILPDDGTRMYLQKRYGAALLGTPGRVGKSMVWQHGIGDTGKSTIQECVAGAGGVFEKYSYVAGARALTDEGEKTGATERFKAYARGKRYVIMDELKDYALLSQDTVKTITGGGTVEGTAKYSNSVSYAFTSTIFISSNHPPSLPPGDTALKNRIHVVPFEHKLWIRSKNPKEWLEASPNSRADEGWKDRVLSDPEERAAIFRWVLDGLILFGVEGLGELPDKMKDASEDFVSDADPVGTLVRSILGLEPGSEASPWLRIATPEELATQTASSGVLSTRLDDLLNARADQMGLIKFGEMTLSRRYLLAAKRMLHEMGGDKRKVRVSPTETAIAFVALREVVPAVTQSAQGGPVDGLYDDDI